MIAAIDCDRRMSYCVREDGAEFRDPHPAEVLLRANTGDHLSVILFEIASPVSFNRGEGGHAAMTQLARWALWNVAGAVECSALVSPRTTFLVSPSNKWTKGFPLDVRHRMARATNKRKDLRECEAMIWFYRQAPSLWVPINDYLTAL